MKRFVLLFLVNLFVPWLSFAQFSFNQDVIVTDDARGPVGITYPGGKKKKKAAANKTESGKKDKKGKKESLEQFAFFAGAESTFGFPVGGIRDSVNNGFGFHIRGEYIFKPNFNIGLATGFRSYKYDKVMVGKGHFTYIPLKLTATYYFAEEKIRPYANLGIGAYLVKEKYDAEFWTWVQNPITHKVDTLYEIKKLDERQTAIGFSPSVGILYQVQDELFANFSVGYDLILTEKKPSSFLGIYLGVIYRFGF